MEGALFVECGCAAESQLFNGRFYCREDGDRPVLMAYWKPIFMPLTTFGFGLTLGATDYYFPSIEGGNDYFDTGKATGAHILELNGGYEISGLSLAANYVLNEAGGAGSAGGDTYFEVGYAYRNINLFVGGGDGLQTEDGDFNITNIGIGVTKELTITPSFTPS